MSSTLQNLLIVLGLVAVAVLGYYLYTQNTNAELNGSSGLVSSQAAAQSADFLRKLNEIKDIELDGSLFSDPRFRSLQNNRPPIVELPVGRDNPFEPVE